MILDPAADGPEVKLIAFFRMYPEGSFCRRVSGITEQEMRTRFILFHALTRKPRFKGRIPSGSFGTANSKRAVSVASRRKSNARRVARKSKLSN